MRELKKLPYENIKVAVMGSRDQFCLDNPTHVKGSALNELCGAKRRAPKKVEYDKDEDYQIDNDDDQGENNVQQENEKQNNSPPIQ